MSESIEKANVIFDSQVLSSIMSCERLTDFRFNMNLVSIMGRGTALEKGGLIHRMLEVYYKNWDKKRAIAIEMAVEAADKYIIGEGQDPAVSNTSFEDIQYVKDTFLAYTQHWAADSWTPVEIEKVKGDVVYEDDEVRVLWKAKFDIIVDTHQHNAQQSILPMDHKTMSQRRKTLDLNNQFMGQCVLAGTNQMVINKIGWQKTLKPHEKFERIMMNYSTDRLEEWKQLVGYYAKYWVSLTQIGYYPPRFTHCDKFGGCQFKDVCSANRNMREFQLKQDFVVGEPWEPSDD